MAELAGSNDPLFLNAILAWLEDLKHEPPELSLSQLDAVLDAQKDFSPRGDRLLTEMRRVRTTMRRCVAQGKPIARLIRTRTQRAGIRVGLPADWLSELGNKPSSTSRALKPRSPKES